MHLLDALREHGEARRPYYKGDMMNDCRFSKFICTDDGVNFWLEWSDTGKFVKALPYEDYNKTRGFTDWNIV